MSRPHVRSSSPFTTKSPMSHHTIGGNVVRAHRPAKTTESLESQRRRNEALEILQSYEKISWYSYQRCETLTQTRLHFQSIIAGLTPAQEEAQVYWKEDFTPHAVKPPQQWNRNRKGKARVSSAISVEAKENMSESMLNVAKEKEGVELSSVDDTSEETASVR